jgi:small GTP-binding protein
MKNIWRKTMNDSKKSEELVFQGRTESIYKIIVVGDPSVGKTSLLTKFSTDKFETQYIPTVGVNIVKEQLELEFQGQPVLINLMLWDIAGQPQFYMLHRPYFNGADGALFVFDITRSSTFSNVNNWHNTCIKHGLSHIPRVLVGNKIDLKDERKIILPMSQHLSEKLSAPFFETSALTGENVDKIFRKIAELVLEFKSK